MKLENTTKQIGVDLIENLLERGRTVLQAVEAESRTPNDKKSLHRLWNLKECAADVGRDHTGIAATVKGLIEKGTCPNHSDDQVGGGGRVAGYTLEQLNALRRHCGTMPLRELGEGPQIIAVQSFKGGVGKTVDTVSIGQYLASQGYKVLLVDMDSQASLTTTFGYIPDLHIDVADTILPYFSGEHGSIEYAVRGTYWPNLDLVPANLQIYNLEFELAGQIARMSNREEQLSAFFTLRRAIDSVKNNYDVVLIDSPPALGMISMNILCAADSFVVPTPPQLYDFSSTLQFFQLVENILTSIAPEKEYDFIKILPSKVMKNRSADQTFLGYMREAFGDNIFGFEMPFLSEIANAAMEFRTVLEDRRPNAKALASIELACGQVELEILKQWPSMRNKTERLQERMKLQAKKLGVEA